MCRYLFLFIGLVSVAMSVAQISEVKGDFILVNGSVDTLEVYYPDTDDVDEYDYTKHFVMREMPDFYIASTCVSVGQYKQFCAETGIAMPKAPTWGWGDLKKPMVNVSFEDAVNYCRWFSDKYQVNVRLPHKDEWIYANYGMFTREEYQDMVPADIELYAEYKENNKQKGSPNCITCKQTNRLGVYDLLGNVWEWAEGFDFNNTDTLNIDKYRLIIGGSFKSSKADMYPNNYKEILGDSKLEDVGFRLLISKNEYMKGIVLEEIRRLMNSAYGEDAPAVFLTYGIDTRSNIIFWKDFESVKIDRTSKTITLKGFVYNKLGSEPCTHTFNYTDKMSDDMERLELFLLAFMDRFKEEPDGY